MCATIESLLWRIVRRDLAFTRMTFGAAMNFRWTGRLHRQMMMRAPGGHPRRRSHDGTSQHYLNFQGQTEDLFTFFAKPLAQVLAQPFTDMPATGPELPAERNLVMHAKLPSPRPRADGKDLLRSIGRNPYRQ